MRRDRALATLALLALAVVCAAVQADGAVIDKIVVVVNNEVITQGEIDRLLQPIYQRFVAMYQGDELMRKLEEVRQMIIGQLIDEKLILGEARKQNIEVEEREVLAKMDDAQRRFGSKEMFDRALAEQRMTMKDLKAKFRDQLMSRKLVDQKVGSRIIITPVDVSEYYRAHAEEFSQPEEIKLRAILIRPKSGLDPEKALDLAQLISRQLREGADFAELARTYSDGPGATDGGMLGYKTRGELLPEIEDAVFRLKDGETSEMLQTGMGYFFFKVEERRQPKSVTLSEARRQIEDAIYSERAKEKMKGWVEGLKKNAYIAFR
jgi:parvulin-like peptidyl-prolyl isomerase